MSLPISLDLSVFLLGTFIAAFVVGVSGFAFGLVAAAVWLQVLPPAQVTALIVIYALPVQGYSVWKVRRSILLARVWPFILGSTVGIPLGVLMLQWVAARHMRLGIGALLIAFSIFNLVRPKMPDVSGAGRIGDGASGVLNGILAGSTGLAGILVVVWSAMRGWKPDEQRAVFQPTAVATFLMCLPAFGSAGMMTADTIRLALIGLPVLIVGTLVGWVLFGKLNEVAFRKVVLWLLLASGIALLSV